MKSSILTSALLASVSASGVYKANAVGGDVAKRAWCDPGFKQVKCQRAPLCTLHLTPCAAGHYQHLER
jgi:hypothetical protein